MWQQNLTADAKHRKCAKVVGDVMGSYHPHGDSAIYETLVRMAQSFSLRYPLIDGSGNFGSLDGDGAAAMRYTECRLARIADEVLAGDRAANGPFPAQLRRHQDRAGCAAVAIPNLLVNGTTGIAVGMATNIPPHNLSEVCTDTDQAADDPDLTAINLCKWVKGPDFPTGGHVLNSPKELKEIYKTGSGSIRLRATWESGFSLALGQEDLHHQHSLCGEQVAARRTDRRHRPQPQDAAAARRQGRVDRRCAHRARAEGRADDNLVMAYLFKNTSLQTTFAVNMTCLVAD
jgi:DNA gyrase subunit A